MRALALTNEKVWQRPLAWTATVVGALAVAVLWSYWPTLEAMASVWARDPQYSHGYLVPLFAGALLWQRRALLAPVALQVNAWGLPFLAASIVLRLLGVYFYFPWLDMVSLLPCLAGMVVLCGGWPAWRWAWPGVAFLFFMLPLPFRLGMLLAPTLQRLATMASTYTLQTLGFPAISEGNIIMLNESRIGVVEACGGLSMLIVFFALATAVALMVQRDLKQKLLIVASAMPIALIANVARITATALLQEWAGRGTADFFHDLAGWFMMPVALAILWLELQMLGRLLLTDKPRLQTAR
jgi:exosortase